MSSDRIDSILEILVCPESRQAVRKASEAEVLKLNQLIEKSSVRNKDSKVVTEPIDTLLVRADGQIGYPVRQGIPVMLIEEGIPLSGIDLRG